MGPPLRVLLVEDDDDNRDLMAEALEAAGHQVLAARAGGEGLERLAAGRVDVVLTDLEMPGIGGLEVARRAKALTPPLPVLVVTGRSERVDLERSGEVDAVLVKPFGQAALAAAVDRVALRSAAGAAGEARPGVGVDSAPRGAYEFHGTADPEERAPMAGQVSSVEELFEKHMPERLRRKPDVVSKIDAIYQFHISGPGGGAWSVDCTKPGGAVTSGEADAQCTVRCGDADFLDIVNGKLSAQMAFMSGKLKIQGDMGLAMKLAQILV